jgi:hypothetical protein
MSKFTAVAITLAAIALPSTAIAHCASAGSSFSASCENGVRVVRAQSQSAMPVGLSAAQAQLEVAKLQAATARAALASQERIARAQADLRAQELENKRYRNMLLERNTRRTTTTIDRRQFGYGFGTGFGYQVARPLRIKH